MAEHHNLYQRAVYYDVVFDRDVGKEVDFIAAVCRRHTGTDLNSMLDIACGPGYHAREFARRGVRTVGLDLRPEMVQFARDKDAAEGLALDWLIADMRDFGLDVPVDAAITMFDGIDALILNTDIVQHFRAVARNLNPRGLYIIDLTHPRDCSYTDYGAFHYHGQRDGTAVQISWGINRPTFDFLTGVAEVEVEMQVTANGQETIIHDSAKERMLMPQEITLLTQLSGSLKVVGWYGDYDLGQPFDSTPASRRMLAVLQKQTGAE
jgi:SAM-dependent methyltransferase